MAVNLVKGQKVDLKKHDGSTLKNVMVGLGWDEVQQKRGFLGMLAGKAQDIDCDASVIMLTGGKLVDTKDLVYFGNLQHRSGAVKHMGDNLTGGGDGDDEEILVDLGRIPSNIDKLVFVVTIYQAYQRHQHFGMIRNAFIRVVDSDTRSELCRYNLSENYDNQTAMIVAEIYRYGSEWKFNAVGQPTKDPGLGELAQRYR